MKDRKDLGDLNDDELNAELDRRRRERDAAAATAADTQREKAAADAATVEDHVHVVSGQSEHEGDIFTGGVYRGTRPPAAKP